MVAIQKLLEENEHFKTVLLWNYNLWYQEENWTLEKLKVYMQQSLNEDCLPITLIASENERVLGTCQIAMNDLDVRPQYYPWLINLSVVATHQGKGIGRALVKEALAEVKRLAFPKIYLYTEHEGYFEQIGFEFIETVETEPGSKQFVRVLRMKL